MEKIFGKWLPSSIWFSKDKMLQLSDSGSKPQWPKILCQWIWTSYDMLRLLAAGKVVHPSWRLQEFGRIAAGPRRMHGTRRSAEDKKKPRCFHSLSTVFIVPKRVWQVSNYGLQQPADRSNYIRLFAFYPIFWFRTWRNPTCFSGDLNFWWQGKAHFASAGPDEAASHTSKQLWRANDRTPSPASRWDMARSPCSHNVSIGLQDKWESPVRIKVWNLSDH